MSTIIPGILHVKGEAGLEKAIANDLTGFDDDKDLTENFLSRLATDYPAGKPSRRSLVEENPADESSNRIVPDGQDFPASK